MTSSVIYLFDLSVLYNKSSNGLLKILQDCWDIEKDRKHEWVTCVARHNFAIIPFLDIKCIKSHPCHCINDDRSSRSHDRCMCNTIRGPVEWHCTRNGWIPYYCKSSIDDLLYYNKLSYQFVFEMPHLNVNQFSWQEFTVPLTWNFTSSNERISSSSEYRASVISQIAWNSRVSRKSSRSKWGFHCFWVSSDHIILEYRVVASIFSRIKKIFRDTQPHPTDVYYTLALSLQ